MDAESLERCYRISFPLKTLRENPLLLFLLLMSPGIPWLPAASLLVFLHLCDLLAMCLLYGHLSLNLGSYSPRASLIAQLVKNLPAMQETPVQFLGQEDLLEKG